MYKEDKHYEILLRLTAGKGMTAVRLSGILYLADKLHLARYGRTVSSDVFIKRGIVPEPLIIHRIIRDGIAKRKSLAIHRVPAIKNDDGALIAVEQYNEDYFSVSDLDVLAETIETYQDMSKRDFINAVIDDAWHKTKENHRISLEHIVDTIDDSDALKDLLGFAS